MNNKGQKAWNKGLKTGLIPKTAFKKGEHPSSKTEFKKGSHPSKNTEFKKGQNAGDKNNFWRGGKMSEYPELVKIRKSKEYKLWRRACMERDNFTDQKTGVSGGYLVVHHINNFYDFPELRLAIDNGITLSKESHKLFHKLYGKKNNTRSQLEEFLTNKPI